MFSCVCRVKLCDFLEIFYPIWYAESVFEKNGRIVEYKESCISTEEICTHLEVIRDTIKNYQDAKFASL